MLVGNKTDQKRAVKREDVEKYASSHGMRYFETCAKDGSNVDEMFQSLTSEIYNVLKEKGERPEKTTVKLEVPNRQN